MILIGFWASIGIPVSAQQVGRVVDDAAPVKSFRSFVRKVGSGLPQSTAVSLLVDRHGVLWVGTLGGLATFDGETMRHVSDPEGPGFLGIRALAEDPDGTIYAGSTEEVFAFDGRVWSRLSAPGGCVQLLMSPDGHLLRLDLKGRSSLWRGPDGGWQELGPAEGQGRISRLGLDGPRVWMATDTGIFRRDEGGEWRQVVPEAPGAISTALKVRDHWWIGTFEGRLFHTTGEGGWQEVVLEDWQGGRFGTLEVDLRGRIWAGGAQGGLAVGREVGDWTLLGPRNGLFPDGVLDLLADPFGSLWIAFNGHGLQQWIGEQWSHRTEWQGHHREERVKVFGISGTENGDVLAVVYDRGFWRIRGQTVRQFGRADGLTEDLRSVVEPEPGVLWAAGRFGVWESRGGEFRQVLKLQHGFANGFRRSPSGSWYLLTSASGLYRYVDEQWLPEQIINEQIPEGNIRDILWRGPGELWLGISGHGVLRFVDQQLKPLPPHEAKDLPTRVNALLEVGDEVWVGGVGGIGIWSAGGSRKWEGGTPGHTVFEMVSAGDDGIWVCGLAGVARIRNGSAERFSSSNGLIEDECNHQGLWIGSDGVLWVGTMASLARYDSQLEQIANPELKVRWRQRPSTDVDGDGVAEVPVDQRTVRLAWHAPWLVPRNLEYRLSGNHWDGWSEPMREPFIVLDDPKPGAWQVSVQARVVGGAWSEPAETRFYVAPRFYETFGFRALLVLLMGMIVWVLIQLRTRLLKRRAEELEERVQAGLAQVKILSGLLPICARCKNVRDDEGYWQRIELFIGERSEANFTHGLCPDCSEQTLRELRMGGNPPPAGAED